MDQPAGPAGRPFQPATEKARLAKLSRSHLMSMICRGTLAAAPPGPGHDPKSATTSTAQPHPHLPPPGPPFHLS
jgi:hypothetical protein